MPAEPLGQRHGTTSACAENTSCTATKKQDGGNYLRVRGEYHAIVVHIEHHGGTTSACAENTDHFKAREV